VGIILLAVGGLLLSALAARMMLPRIGYRPGLVLFYLRGGRPVEVPVEVVEAFLVGQGPTLRPGERHRREQTKTVVVRLAEKAVDWARRDDIKPSLGGEPAATGAAARYSTPTIQSGSAAGRAGGASGARRRQSDALTRQRPIRLVDELP
jgi:hypothetical protein